MEVDNTGNLKIINRQSTTDTTVIQLDKDGDATFSGNITSEGGSIGGFTISETALTGGSAGTTVALTPGTGIHIGSASFASAPFSVDNSGELNTESAKIGNWVVAPNLIRAPNNTIRLDAANQNIILGASLLSFDPAPSTDILILEGSTTGPLAFRLRVGALGNRPNEAPFRISGSGHVFASDITVGNVVGTANPPGEKLQFVDGTLTVSASDFFMGSSAQFISGSEGNIEISSSNFHLTAEGEVTMSGNITAAGGTVGGWSLSSTTLSSGDIDIDSDNDVITVGTDADYDIKLGKNTDGPFFQMGSALDDGTGTGMFMQIKDPGGGAGDRVTFNLLQDTSGGGAGGFTDFIKMSPAGNTGLSIKASAGITTSTIVAGNGSSTTPAFQLNSTNDGFYHSGGIRLMVNNANDFMFADGGTFHADADVIAYSSTISDKRLKDDVKTIEFGLDKVKNLRGVEFTWNKGSREGERDIGVIAQEVEKVESKLVREHEMPLLDESGKIYKTVDYEKITAVLIEAVKEQQEQIDELKKEVEELKNA